MSSLSVQYIIRNFSEINSLGRYTGALLHELQQMSGVEMCASTVEGISLLSPLFKGIKQLGIDAEAFLRTYPLIWPAIKGNLIHLTQRTQTSMLLRKPSVPVVVTVHDIIHYQYRNNPSMHIYRHGPQKWFDGMSIQALRRADAILASSEYTRQALIDELNLDSNCIHKIYLGVDQERFKEIQVPDSFKQKYKIDPSKRYIIHVSTEEVRKDFTILLRTFAAIHSHYPDVHLLKIGRPLYPEMRARHLALIEELCLGDKVTFIDEVSDDDLVRFYNISYVMVLPSLSEGFGFPVLEAMACGSAVICSTGGSLPEIAGDAALLFTPGNLDELAHCLRRILDDSQLYDQLKQAGCKQVATFTWLNTAQQTLEVYRKVAKVTYA